MTKYYPQTPTDWTTALEKIYAKQSDQLQRYHDQLRQRDQQLVAKAGNESLANTLGSLAQFSSTISKAVQQSQVRKDKQDLEYKTKLENMFSLNPELSEGFIKSISEYKGDRNDIWKDSTFFDPLLASLSEKSKEAAQAILKQDPRRMIIFQETLARQFSTQLPFLADRWLSDEKAKDPERWENFSDEQKITEINRYKAAELAKFGISEKAGNAILAGELKRQTETIKGTRTASTNDKFFKQNHALQLSILEVAGGAVDIKALPQAVHEAIILTAGKDFSHIEDGDTKLQRATESVIGDLIHLSKNSFIPNGALAGLEDYKFPHPAGKGGKASVIDAFFKKDSKHFSLLIEALDEGQNGVLDVQTEIDQGIYEEASLLKTQGKYKEADELMRPLIGRDLLTQEQYADYERINPKEQSKEYETDRDAYYTDLELRGKLPSIEELNQEPNKAMRDKWVKIKKDKEKWKSDNKHSYNTKLFENEVYKLRTTRSLEPGQPITQEDGAVVQKLVDFSEMRLAYYLGQDRINGTTTPNIAALIKQDVDTFKVGNGWGTDEGGMFSLDKSKWGEHKWANINKVDMDLGYGTYNHNKPSADRESKYNKIVQDNSNLSVDERREIPEAIFSNRMMLGFKQNGYFSEDMKYIAAREGLTLPQAFELALKSMDPEFAKLHNFKQLPEEAKANLNAHRKLEDGLDTVFKKASDSSQKALIQKLRSKLKYQGWDYFTPKDKIILIEILSTQDE